MKFNYYNLINRLDLRYWIQRKFIHSLIHLIAGVGKGKYDKGWVLISLSFPSLPHLLLFCDNDLYRQYFNRINF